MRLLIIANSYPPSPYIASSNRIKSFMEYLPKYGIYPILITRQWDLSKTLVENSISEIGKHNIEKNKFGEVHYIKNSMPIANKITNKYKIKNKYLMKALSLFVLILGKFFYKYTVFYKWKEYAIKLVADNNNTNNKIDKILISGDPFELFKIGHDIKKTHNVAWVADYRDGWNCGHLPSKQNIIFKILKYLDRYNEQKWLSNAEYFTTVTPYLKNLLQQKLNKKGYLVYNGYFERYSVVSSKNIQNNSISFVYSGTIKSSQQYEEFLNIFEKYAKSVVDKSNLKITFIGAFNINDPIRIKYKQSSHIFFTDILFYKEALEQQQNYDISVMFSYKGTIGISSSKIFDYLNHRKPILLYKSDGDILDELVIKSGLGIIASTEDELMSTLDNLVDQKIKFGKIIYYPDDNYINSFQRSEQVKYLAKILVQV